MANGTCSRRARVCASAVLPQPVGPIRRTLLLETSTSCELGVVDLAAQDALVVVDDGDGQRLLHPLLADDVLVQVGDQLLGVGSFSSSDILPLMLGEEAVAGLDAVAADVRDRPAREPAGTSALPSIIGPASALFRPQKSQSTGAVAPGDELSSVVQGCHSASRIADRK